jgi:uncharacterized protein
MKWSVSQLRKLTTNPYHFSLELDFSSEAEQVEDILSIGIALVKGTISRVDDDIFRCVYHLKVDLVLSCSLTLEPVNYSMNFEQEDLIGYANENYDDVVEISGNTVDLKAIVWDNIIVNIPIRIVRDDAYEILASRNISLDEDISDEE